MEFLVLFIIGLVIAMIVLPFVALAKANSVENEVRNLRPEVVPAVQPEVTVAAMQTVPLAVPITTVTVIVPEKELVPPPIPERFIKEAVPQITAPAKPPINWEQFMGAKLFAWVGGLALFLGVAFFVKYSFEHNLISPEQRVAIGFAVGASLVIGGLLLKRKENAVAINLVRRIDPTARVAIIGSSLGGVAALLATPPLKVDALILEEVYPTIETATRNQMENYLGGVGRVLTPALLNQLQWRLGVSASQLRPVDHIGDVQCPVFIISGEKDRNTRPADTRMLFEHARSLKQLWFVPNAGHVDLHRAAREEYEIRVLAFLAQMARS